MKEHIFNYDWRLADGFPAEGVEHHGCKSFGTFVCGGGSSMGYKLAGYDHLGGVELAPKVAEIYRRNLSPKYLFIDDIRDFNRTSKVARLKRKCVRRLPPRLNISRTELTK